MRVLLTGATGFLGKALAQRLIARGSTVRALVRASSRTASLEKMGAEIVRADLSVGNPDLLDALRNIDAVVHAAGGGMVKSDADFYVSNRDSVEALLVAAEAVDAQLHRFVFVSSLAAHGPAPDGRPAREEDAPHPVSHYGKSKLEGEDRVRSRSHRFDVAILRPPAIYGPADTRMVGLYRWTLRGVQPSMGGGTLSIVHRDDCVDALLLLLDKPVSSGRTFFVDDGLVHTKSDLMAAIRNALGKNAIALPLPSALLKVAGAAVQTIGGLRGRATVFRRDKVQDLLQPHWVCSSDRLRSELGYESNVGLREGIASTAQWYLDQGWI